MPQFYLKNPHFSPATIEGLRSEWWSRIPDPEIAKLIATEHQYFQFHMHLLRQLEYRGKAGRGDLDRSLRAGAIKAAQLMCSSIIEAALRVHGEDRGYKPLRDSKPEKRTFGKVVEAWSKKGWAEVAHVKDDVLWFKDLRDNVHLFQAKAEKRTHPKLLEEESTLNEAGRRVIVAVSQLDTPY